MQTDSIAGYCNGVHNKGINQSLVLWRKKNENTANICIKQMAILEKNVNAVYTWAQSLIESGAEFLAEHLISAEQYESIKAKYIPQRDNLADMIKAIRHNSLRAVWMREYSGDDNPWIPAPDPLTEKEKELVQAAMEHYYDF